MGSFSGSDHTKSFNFIEFALRFFTAVWKNEKKPFVISLSLVV